MAEPNFKNRTLWTGDNLDIMRGLNSETVDLIYLDPPFNSNRDYAAPIGSEAAGAAFKDTWTLDDVDLAWHGEIAEANPALYRVIDAAREAHGKGMQSYLIMMAVRLLEMKRLLKSTGSIYLHCDPTASHYLKLLMDTVFGKDAFRNEIIWHYSGWNARLKSQFNSRHDTILVYSRSKVPTFNSYAEPWASEEEYLKVRKQKRRVDETGRAYVSSDAGKGKRVRRYLDEAMQYGKPASDVWILDKINNSAKEHIGYPTQKPLALLERIIHASSNEGDIVLDPFCGCATALVAAEKLQRQWVGIDLSPQAQLLIKSRLGKELGLFSTGTVYRDDVPQRTDMGKLPPYQTHKHTLYGMQEGICAGCKILFPYKNFTVDHVVPKDKGGTDHIENLQLLCGHCNSVKGTKTQEEFLAALRSM